MTTEAGFKFWNFNIWQSISATGLIGSAMAQLGLTISGKAVPDFLNVYPIWLGIFGLATLLKYYFHKKNGGRPIDHHHHH